MLMNSLLLRNKGTESERKTLTHTPRLSQRECLSKCNRAGKTQLIYNTVDLCRMRSLFLIHVWQTLEQQLKNNGSFNYFLTCLPADRVLSSNVRSQVRNNSVGESSNYYNSPTKGGAAEDERSILFGILPLNKPTTCLCFVFLVKGYMIHAAPSTFYVKTCTK